jgi:Flp pilus assembly protein TadD
MDEIKSTNNYVRGLNDYIKNLNEYLFRLDPQNAVVWTNKAAALRALGRTTEADEAFAKAKGLGYTG